MISYILAIICGFVILGLDQYTKYLVVTNFTLGESYDFIKGFMDLTYIHNRGGAWGMLSGYTWVLLSITIIIMLVCLTMLIKVGLKNKLMFWAITLVLFGGIGNLIDRIFRDGNVVDFLHFAFFRDFPVFNIADCSIVVGSGLLILYFLIETYQDAKKKKEPRLNTYTDYTDNNNEKV